MDFNLTEQQKALQETVRKFAQQELPNIARQIEINDEPVNLALRRRYGELGYLGVNLDSSVGGGGMSHLDAVIVLEEIAKISIAVAFPIFEARFGPSLAIAHFGSDSPGKGATYHRSVLEKSCGSVHVGAGCRSALDRPEHPRRNHRRKNYPQRGTKRWCSGAGHFGSLCGVLPTVGRPRQRASERWLLTKALPASVSASGTIIWDSGVFTVATCTLTMSRCQKTCSYRLAVSAS